MMKREEQIELMNALGTRNESPLRAWIDRNEVRELLFADLSSYLPSGNCGPNEPAEKILAFG